MLFNQNPIHIGVIIVNYNSAAYLAQALSALAKQTRLPDEVIVLDNASTEQFSLPATEGLKIKVIQSDENLGFSAGNNRAIENLDPAINWIALLNPDAYPEIDWLEKMIAAIQTNPQYAFFGCKLICANEPHLLDGTGDAYHISGKAWRMHHRKSLNNAPHALKEIFSPCAAAALYNRKAFESIAGFDEQFFCYYEDIDLSFRLRLLGYKCGYVYDAIVAHTGSATTKRHSVFYTYYGHRNLVWTYFKNMPLVLLIIFFPLHILLNIVSILAMLKHRQVKTICKAKYDALKGLKNIFLQRKTSPQRVISIKELMRVLHKGLPW